MPALLKQQAKAAALAHLRQQIQSLEGFKTEGPQDGFRLDVPAIENCLPGGTLAAGAIHEFIGSDEESAAAASGFIAALLAGRSGPVVWIVRDRTLYAPGLRSFGLLPETVIFAEAPHDREALWAMEEALRCSVLAAVVGEIRDADLTATRRLQLAAESSGVTGFLLRRQPKSMATTSCITRWLIGLAPGADPDGLPGLGAPGWQVELARARGGRPGKWHLCRRDGKFVLPEPQKKEAPPPVRKIAQAV